jgi:hypothetical protein
MLQVFLPLIGVQHIRAFKGQGQECAAARVKSFAARGSVFSNNAFHLETSILPVEYVYLRMVTSNSSEQPAWQRNPIFEFFASLKLAVVCSSSPQSRARSMNQASMRRLRAATFTERRGSISGLFCSARTLLAPLFPVGHAQTSCRVSHHGSRYHYAPDGENSRNGILCTPSVNRPRERRTSMRPRSAG